MKILQIIDTLHIGGAERMAVNMANAFCDAGIKNVLVCTRSTGPLLAFVPSSTEYYELHKKSSFDLAALRRLFKLVKEEKPTVVHAHSTSVYWAFLVKFFYPRIRLIWHDHYGLSESLKKEDRKSIKYISGYIDGVLAVNDILKHWSVKNLQSKQVSFLQNFAYSNTLNRKTQNNRYIILHLANLRPQKDHITLIEAIRILKTKTFISFQVWCAGNDTNDAYSFKLKQKIKEYDLDDTIKILGSVQDTSALLEKANIGILCSESEGMPVSLLEYGLAALPVVVTEVGKCADVVGFGKYGLVVPKANPTRLADGLAWHIENKEKSIQMGDSFQKHIKQEYGAQKFLDEYLQFISKL